MDSTSTLGESPQSFPRDLHIASNTTADDDQSVDYTRLFKRVPFDGPSLKLAGDECSICKEQLRCAEGCPDTHEHAPVDAEMAVRLEKCGHTFGEACITQWIEASPSKWEATCPMCREPVFPEDMLDDESEYADSEDGDTVMRMTTARDNLDFYDETWAEHSSDSSHIINVNSAFLLTVLHELLNEYLHLSHASEAPEEAQYAAQAYDNLEFHRTFYGFKQALDCLNGQSFTWPELYRNLTAWAYGEELDIPQESVLPLGRTWVQSDPLRLCQFLLLDLRSCFVARTTVRLIAAAMAGFVRTSAGTSSD